MSKSMYTINKITEISMDTSKQKSLLDVVNTIINQTQSVSANSVEDTIVPDMEILAEAVEMALNTFEQMFEIDLNEEQETNLIDFAIDYVKNNREIENIDLTEDSETLINNYTPQQVFLRIFEDISKEQLKAAAERARRAIEQARQSGSEELTVSDVARRVRRGPVGTGQQDDPSTLNPYSSLSQLIQQAQQQSQRDPSTMQVSRYVNEETQNSLKKHKKKIFKITFMDGGVKRKGTAVSHKGVMRIVSGRSSFKVYDENNRDITSQFSSSKKHKK